MTKRVKLSLFLSFELARYTILLAIQICSGTISSQRSPSVGEGSLSEAPHSTFNLRMPQVETKLTSVSVMARSKPRVDFRLKPNTLMRKLMLNYSDKVKEPLEDLIFLYGGQKIKEEDTVSILNMDQGDIIQVVVRGVTSTEETISLKFMKDSDAPKLVEGWKLLKDWTKSIKTPVVFYLSPEGKKFRCLKAATRFINFRERPMKRAGVSQEFNFNTAKEKMKAKIKKRSKTNPLLKNPAYGRH